jgi:methionyl-tRNA formyltransferase
MLTVVVIGQKWLAENVLSALIDVPGVAVVAVVPPDPADRLAALARERGMPTYTLEDCPPADLAVAAHLHRFLPGAVRARFRLGVLAYHPSLLPAHRGRDAVRWAIHMRERVTGGTVYWMDDGADTGPVEAQEFCHILPDETPAELWRRALAPIGLQLIAKAVARLASGAPPRRIPQDERLATFEPAFSPLRYGGIRLLRCRDRRSGVEYEFHYADGQLPAHLPATCPCTAPPWP